jgi:hypothetical protein
MFENHWNGSLLDDRETVLNFAKTMTLKENVKLIDKLYASGVKLAPKQMADYKAGLERCGG